MNEIIIRTKTSSKVENTKIKIQNSIGNDLVDIEILADGSLATIKFYEAVTITNKMAYG